MERRRRGLLYHRSGRDLRAQQEQDSAEDMAQSTMSKPESKVAIQPTKSNSGMRVWTDNTGKYQVVARLVTIKDGKVRLLKETGRHTTVPFERLSRTDLAFVRSQTPIIASK